MSSSNSSRQLSESLASAVESSSNASLNLKDSYYYSAAKKEASKSNLPTHVIQVMRKIKKAKLHPDAEDNELRILAEELTDKEKLYIYFSHIIQDDQEAVVQEGTKLKFEKDMNSEEAANAKEREQMRYDKLASLTLTVCLQDIPKQGKKIAGKTVVTFANFLSMKYSSKHAAILVNDVILEWGQESLVIPRRVGEDEVFLFQGGIQKLGDYFNQLAEARPKSEEAPKAFDEEIQVLSHPVEIKRKIIDNIIDVIVQFNSALYYHPISRNCQQFVQKIVRAATNKEEEFSPVHEAVLEDIRKGKLPTFRCHEDIDAYVMRKGVGSFTKDKVGSLIRVYDMYHGGEDCEVITCKHKELLQRLVE